MYATTKTCTVFYRILNSLLFLFTWNQIYKNSNLLIHFGFASHSFDVNYFSNLRLAFFEQQSASNSNHPNTSLFKADRVWSRATVCSTRCTVCWSQGPQQPSCPALCTSPQTLSGPQPHSRTWTSCLRCWKLWVKTSFCFT